MEVWRMTVAKSTPLEQDPGYTSRSEATDIMAILL